MQNKLDDMRYLFGDVVVCLAGFVDVDALGVTPETISRISGMANTMMGRHGVRKLDYVARLSFMDRLLLCIWLSGLRNSSMLMAAAHEHQ